MSSIDVKRKRVVLNIETKVHIIDHFKKGEFVSNLAPEYEFCSITTGTSNYKTSTQQSPYGRNLNYPYHNTSATLPSPVSPVLSSASVLMQCPGGTSVGKDWVNSKENTCP